VKAQTEASLTVTRPGRSARLKPCIRTMLVIGLCFTDM